MTETDEEGERMRRRVVLVAVLALLGCPGASAASDTATVVDVTCTSNVEDGLTDTYNPCTSTDSTVKSGRRRLAPSPGGTCGPEAKGTTGKDYIVWSNGQVSTWEYTRDVSLTNGSVRIHQEGTITAGLFAGGHAVEDLTVIVPAAYLRGSLSDQRPDDCQTAEGGASPEPLLPGRYLATGELLISRG